MSKLIKRKDGSYSPRGLWDNIRANIGSGKEPTKEMLAQEKKIKRKMEEGGELPKQESSSQMFRSQVPPRRGKFIKPVKQWTGRNDSKLEDVVELFDPTGISSWDDTAEAVRNIAKGKTKNKGLKTIGAIASSIPLPTVLMGVKPIDFRRAPQWARTATFFRQVFGVAPNVTRAVEKTASPILLNQSTNLLGNYDRNSRSLNYQTGGQLPDTKSWYESLIENLNPFTWFDEEEVTAPVVKEQPKPVVAPIVEPVKPQKSSDEFPEEVLLWQAHKESGGFNPDVISGKRVSSANAKGLTQIRDVALQEYYRLLKKTPKQEPIDLTKPEDAVKVQRFLMNDHYNNEYATKGNPTKQVRQAKALAFYNLGRQGTIKILNKSKAGGKDIYRSLDWLEDLPLETRDYIQKVLLHKIPKYNEQFHRDTTNSPYPELFGYEKGGIITDPRGQWAYPGKVTRIPSDVITMQGVKQPLLGVSDKGEQKLMIPNKNYKFADAKYVTEYPLKEKGGIMNKLGNTSKNRRDLLKVGIQIPQSTLYPLPFAKGGLMQGRSGIYIKPENRGKFTAWAKSKGMGVQEAASQVMANKEEYSPTIVKRANFAKNAAGWNKADGGQILWGAPQSQKEKILARGGSMAMNYNLGNMNIEPKSYAQGGGIDNPGFKALPDFVQAKIRANMEQGGVMKYRMGGRTKFNKMC